MISAPWKWEINLQSGWKEMKMVYFRFSLVADLNFRKTFIRRWKRQSWRIFPEKLQKQKKSKNPHVKVLPKMNFYIMGEIQNVYQQNDFLVSGSEHALLIDNHRQQPHMFQWKLHRIFFLVTRSICIHWIVEMYKKKLHFIRNW